MGKEIQDIGIQQSYGDGQSRAWGHLGYKHWTYCS